MVNIPSLKGLGFASMKKNVERSLTSIEKMGYQFQRKLDLATRQEFQIEYNSMMRNSALSSLYRVDYADDAFDVTSAPWLRSMDSKFGEKICLEITMINKGWQELAEYRRAFGMTVARCTVWEPYIIGNDLKERAVVRELDAETALQFNQILKRQETGQTDKPRAEILEAYEIESLISPNDNPKKERRMLEASMNYIFGVDIAPCYKYATRVAYGNADVGTDAPIVITPPAGSLTALGQKGQLENTTAPDFNVKPGDKIQ
jgi:hypothetical protein